MDGRALAAAPTGAGPPMPRLPIHDARISRGRATLNGNPEAERAALIARDARAGDPPDIT